LSVADLIESKNLEIVLTNTATDVAIVIEPDLKLNPRFDVMTGTLFVKIYPASAALKTKLKVTTPKEALDKPIYKTKVMATYELPHFTEEIDENAVKWTENNGKLFLEGLDKVIRSLGVQLEGALKNPHTTME
jgi:ATP-dependent protease HslVU (ClpYQ) ATPase subunit